MKKQYNEKICIYIYYIYIYIYIYIYVYKFGAKWSTQDQESSVTIFIRERSFVDGSEEGECRNVMQNMVFPVIT